VAAENIYQMFIRHGRCGFFVKRNSWTHPGSAACIVTVDGLEAGALSGKPPYFNNPKVIADIAYQGRVTRTELSSPGTYAYTEIGKPNWWPNP
jgi:hypothetical protein